MEFFRKAYDTLGSEISKTFDSSKDQAEPDVSLKSGASPHNQDWADTPNKSKRTDDEDSWGEWGTSAAVGTRKAQAVTEGKGPAGRTPSGPARRDPSSESSDAGERGVGGLATAPSSQDVAGNSAEMAQQVVPGGGGGSGTETGSVTPLATSTPAKGTGKSQLESLSKEELIKYVRKQVQLLQKTKSRCDELTKECEQLKSSISSQSSSPQGSEALLDELQVLKVERDAAVAELKGLKQAVSELEGEKKHVSSQLTSTKEEYDLLRQSFRQLQEDMASREEDLRCQLEASHTRMSAITEQARDREKDLQREIMTLSEQMNELATSNRDMEAKLQVVGDGKREGDGTDGPEGRGINGLKEGALELAATKEELSLLEQRCNQLQTSELRLQEESKGLLKELESVRQQLDTSAEDARQMLDMEKKKTSEEMERLRLELKTLREELMVNKKSSGQRVAALTQQQSDIEVDLGRRLSAAMATITKEQGAKEAVAVELADARSRMGQLQKLHSDASEQLHLVSVEKEALHKNCEALKAELASAQQRVHQCEKEAMAAGCTRESVLQEKQHLEELLHEERRSASAQDELLKSELEGLRLQLKAAIAEKELVNQEKDGAAEDRKTLESRVLELEDLLQRKGCEMDAAKQAAHLTISDMESRLQVQERDLESARVERDRLQANRDTLESELGSTHQAKMEACLLELQQLGEENRLLRDARLQLSSELEQMRCSGMEVEKKLVAMEKNNEELQIELQKVQEQCAKSAEEQDSSQKEELKKLKMFVVKLKKELNESKTKEASLKQQLEATEGSPDMQEEVKALKTQLVEEQERTATAKSQVNIVKKELEEEVVKMNQDRQRMTEECLTQTKVAEGLARELEAAKAELTSLQTKQVEAHSTVTQLTVEKESLATTIHRLTESRDLLQSEVNALQSDLSTVISEKNAHKLTLEAAQKELTSLRDELAKEKTSNVEFRDKLATMEKEVKANSVMDLELADYRRSVEQLQSQLSERDSKMELVKKEKEEFQRALELQKKEMEAMKLKASKQEESLKKISAVVKTKMKEIEDARKQETDLQANIAQLQTELEAQKQLAEGAKVEVADLTAQLLSVQQQSQASGDVLQKIVSAQEAKISSLQAELKTTQTNLQAVQQEYESYKVRVHSVLKQKSSGSNEAETSRELRQKFEAECLELKAELKGTKERLVCTLAEHQELSAEHENLVARHEQMMKDLKDTQERLTKKLHEEEARHLTQSQEQADLITQLKQEMHSMAAAFKDQLHALKDSGQRLAEGLKEELRTAHAEINRLQREADAQVLARAAAGTPDGSSGRMLYQQERLPRESFEQTLEMESTSSFPATPITLSRENSQLSLEHLLSGPDADSTAPTEKLSNAEVSKLRQQLKVAGKKMDHLTELLRESEASSLRLGEQTKLLKEEIRRLERNQQREESVANMEYLKNVVLKFLQGKAEERTNLVPVITRLLQLSPHEVAYVEQTLKGNTAEIPNAASELASHSSAAKKGWASYMQRWTGY